MQRVAVALICSLLLFFCFGPISAEAASECRHDKVDQVSQRTRGTRKYCDPSFHNQTAGEITQKCSSGFYRENIGPNMGQCVPCSCNGLSSVCDPHTGICKNCQHNTTGDHCERCKQGYYGNVASRTCRACPCPSSRKNFALACLDISSEVIECLCRRGYSGARCERCAFGYYGNPLEDGGSCKPCNCDNGHSNRNMCNNRTGECILYSNSTYECDGCTITLQLELEKLHPVHSRLEQQLQNITNTPGSVLWLKPLEAKISDAQALVGSYSSTVKKLDAEVELAGGDVNVFRSDLRQLIDKSRQGAIDGEKVLSDDTNVRAAVLLFEAETLLATIQDVSWRRAEAKPGESDSLSGIEEATMMEEAQRIVNDLQRRSCSWHRLTAGREQEDAHMMLDSVGQHVAVGMDRAAVNRTADFIMAYGSLLEQLSDLLTTAEDTVDTAKGLNLKSQAALRHLELDNRNNSQLYPLIEMTKSLLKNGTNTFLMLQDVKTEFENQAAQTDGARRELVKRLNTVRPENKADVVTEAEEHAEGLLRAAMELQQALHGATAEKMGFSNSAVREAERAADRSRETAERALQDVTEGGLADRAERLKEISAALRTEADETGSDLNSLSSIVIRHKDRVNTQRDKRQSSTDDVSTLDDNIKTTQRDDIDILVELAKNVTSASNSTVSNIAERLRNISQEVDKIQITKGKSDILNDADQTVENLNRALPELHQKIEQVQALSKRAPPGGNMTESIWRIKDVIEETRNYVNRLPIATTFNGKSHVELHPPRDLEDLKAFTAVDLLLSGRLNKRRRRQQNKRSHGSSFVLYLGSRNASGDYIGMALRENALKCVYKLAGTVHQVDTSQLTTSSAEAFIFDRVVFRRVYQDAEVDVTLDFTSQKPLRLPPRRNLPNTTNSLLRLDPDSLVLYVGGYPENFTPPVELRYPGYRGAMKLSYINDKPVSLFNYKSTNNLDAKQPLVKIPWSKSSAYYQGTGYSMALVKGTEKKRRLLKFHTNSRETNALLFYIGNEETFICVFLERSFLVLQGKEAGREFRLSSANKVSLLDQQFSIEIKADTFTLHCRTQRISTHHNQTAFKSYYIGGLPEVLRQRHNITAPALRGCVDHLTADTVTVEPSRTVGVTDGCPVSLLAVRSATLRSPLSADSLFARSDQPLRVSLGFRSSSSHGTVLKSSHQGFSSVQDFQLSLVDGFAVVKRNNYTLRTDTKCNDGKWHHLSAVNGPAGLELSIDNTRVTRLDHSKLQPNTEQEGDFTSCITNLYTRRLKDGVEPADPTLLSPPGDGDFGLCRLSSPPISEPQYLPVPVFKTAQRHTPIEAPAGSRCKKRRVQRGEHHFPQGHSWVSYSVPEGDLNYRPHFSIDIKTKSSKGLILHAGSSGVVPLLALYLANGKIKMTLGHNRTIHHKLRSNDGKWHRVELSVEKSSFHLVVDRFRVTDGVLPNNEGSSLQLLNPVYLGADLGGRNTKGHSVPMSSVTGCVRNFKMNEEVLWDAESSYGTLPCFSRLTEKGTYFGGGYIFSDINFFTSSQFDLAFELRPHHLTGLLFMYRNDRMSIVVFMKETEVVVEVDNGGGVVSVAVSPRETLCDGKFHLVKVYIENKELHLAVDAISKKNAAPAASPSNSSAVLYIGGTTKGNKATVSSPFVGCLRNVKLGGRPVELEAKYQVFGAVSINSCPAD